MTSPSFIKLDNYSLSNFQQCPSKFQLRIEDGWTSRGRSAALAFGISMHAGLAEWYKGLGRAQAITAITTQWDISTPIDDYRTMEKCISVFDAYARRYPFEAWTMMKDPSGQPFVECAFSLDTGLVTDLGTPIIYGGVFDGLVDYGGQIYVIDHKTTSQMGDYFFEQFKPNNQMCGYVWAARQLSQQKVTGVLINGICVLKVSAPKFDRQVKAFYDADIEEWLRDLQAVASQIEYHRKRGYFPRHTTACTLYGKCEFHSLHLLSTARERENLLDIDYVREPWDFERRGL